MHTKLPLIEQLINNSLIWFIRHAWPLSTWTSGRWASETLGLPVCLSVCLDGGETERGESGEAEVTGNVQGKENNLHPSIHPFFSHPSFRSPK